LDKLIFSDTHYHNFARFAVLDDEGVNSRVLETIEATKEAAKHAKSLGIKIVFHGGDCFHVRGKISPSVLNPVIELYRYIVQDLGMQVYMIAGNHDLEGRDSTELSNTATALKGVGVDVISEPKIYQELKTVFLPYIHQRSDLMKAIEECTNLATGEKVEDYTLVIHTALNDVIKNIPNNGLNASELSVFGFKQILCGHYHNHKQFDGVMSVGALTHQSFSDINSKAGYVIEQDDKYTHYETKAPKFVDVDQAIKKHDFEAAVKDNFVRARLEQATQTQVNALRDVITSAGAKGVIILNTPKQKRETVRQNTSNSSESVTIEASVALWVKDNQKLHTEKVTAKAIALLQEIENEV
jgi:DNA repair exonuclease SbcCD nuclease subunit